MAANVCCPACRQPVSDEIVNLGDLLPCPACNVPMRVMAFPALVRPVTAGETSRDIADASQSACFYHPEKQATVPCDACGRFLCALCDVELAGEHLCPGCVDAGRKQGKLAAVENKRTLYDRLAIMYAIWPILIWPFTLVTAPYALYLCFRHYRSPGSFVRPGKWRFWVAGLLAAAQVIGWTVFLVYLIGQSM